MPGRKSRVFGGLLLAAVMAVCTAPGTAGAAADAGSAGTVPSVGTDWGRTGPYEVAVDIEAVHTFYYPRNMGQSGERHPVVIWGNGTGAVPGIYSSLLRHWASQGFIVAAANTPTSNFAISMRAGIDVLEHRNADSSSVFHGKVDLDHIASAGHSQGGAAAVNAAIDPRVDTAIPIQPGPLTDPDLMDEPVFYLAGQRDLTVWPALVKALYRDTDHAPAVYGEVRGAGHLSSIGDGGDFRAPTTAWLRYWLLGDENARGMFFGPGCGYCVDSDLWSGWDRNAQALQIPGPAA
ncbi:acetylxylan esterase [Streptomyces sp. NBC_00233]|uniref:poly(ethylene terephthalate) hydrolase family protein n=1 Tax=Streptomyces sp. NBC_00233 TaxID=2975686 RepID=UPI002255DEFE|nr:acetylxylan esterase [Streptomyces sp. NBC_00233]MCX5231040.1 acetylxylan esterase [Streptomyces sp. NBC_00233]